MPAPPLTLPAWLHGAFHQESDNGHRTFAVTCPRCGEPLGQHTRGTILTANVYCPVCDLIVGPALPPCPFPHEEVTP